MNILFFLTLTLAQMHCPDSSFDLSSNSKDAVLDLFTSLKGNSVHCLIETLGKPQEIRYDIKWPNKHGYMSPPFYMPEVAAEEGGVESGGISCIFIGNQFISEILYL